jgi:hypothetical protein
VALQPRLSRLVCLFSGEPPRHHLGIHYRNAPCYGPPMGCAEPRGFRDSPRDKGCARLVSRPSYRIESW